MLVPAAFVWNVTASNTNPRRQNQVFNENSTTGTPSSSVGARYPSTRPTRTIRASRSTNSGKVANGTNVPLWVQNKYPAVSQSIPIATGVEMHS